MEARELQEAWFRRALDRAGIDRGSWRPGRGVEENRRTIEAVYGYYGRLFLEHPYLQWAGLAAMIGPAFYAGFLDLGVLPDAVRGAVIAALGRTSRRLARRAAGDLGFYETTFLTMQKKIFEDQAVMHEAYLAGGIAQIEELYRARIIDAATVQAWRQIDAGRGDPAADAVADGNRTLLFREQHDIIDRYYVRMLGHRRPLGPAFTYLLTLAGSPSVPRAQPFPQRYPLRVEARMPPIAISARTPLADGNIAIFADRWKLIDTDTLPAYLAFIRNHPGRARAMVAIPLSQRVTGYRLLARAGQLAAGALTRWDVDLRAAPSKRRTPGARAVRRPLQAAATVIDLSSAPTRESAGFGAGTGSRIWMSPGRVPFDVTITLPGGRAYHARAEMAVMLASAPAGDPDRLTVQLPPAGLDATTQLIGDYAARWGFPAAAVTAWRASAAQRTSGDRYYSTHVFTPADTGPVHLEFQVSHHVGERTFIVAALFSWPLMPRLSADRHPARTLDDNTYPSGDLLL
ncbi:MAG TPA: hypothetical protein VGL33_11725 [Streptosporangiaceae bacterium]